MTAGTPRPERGQPAAPVRPDGPGRITPGQRVTCLPGSLPARDGGRGGGVLVSIGPKTSLVDVYGDRQRRIPNYLLHPDAGPWVAADRNARGLRTATASGRDWLPGWSWLGWTIAEHLEYQHGQRQLPTPPPPPQRLVIVACGARKKARFEAPAGQMYVGSYHRTARRAADTIATPGTRVMILSAMYGLLDPDDVILRYEMRLGQRHAITAPGLREQAEQLGLTHTGEVIVLAPAAYAALTTRVWPHALLPLTGTRGIGAQMARLSALATGRTTVEDLINRQTGPHEPQTQQATGSGDQPHTVSVHGGLVHLAHTPPGRAGTAVPVCPAGQPGRRWQPTPAAITCTRCAAIAARRRAVDRWCALVTRCAQTTNTGTAHRDATPGPATQRDRARGTRPGRGRPAITDRRRPARPIPARRPGGTPLRTHRDDWRLVPTGPPRAVPLQPTAVPRADRPSRKRNPHHPRPPIGRAPPQRVDHPRQPVRRPASAGHHPDPVPLTPNTPPTRQNIDARNTSANSGRQASPCTTTPSPGGGTLANPLPAAGPGRPANASTNRSARPAPGRSHHTVRDVDRTPEVEAMPDLTASPAQATTPGPAPVNQATVPDARTLRQVARAEQDRLTADAVLERRAREAELDLRLREQRRAAARRERHAKAADKQARRQRRQQRQAARRARLRAAAPRWADRALFVLPIMFPMAVAWVGQIRFAMTVMGWPLPAAIVFAAGFELSTAYVARLDWLSRAAGDSGLLFRAATWGFATGAATMNYWHAADPGFTPNGEAVSYGLMSITGILLWELLSTYRHRTALRAHGKRPAARPRFGMARWIWFPTLTRLAWLLTLRDGHTTTDSAWRAALTAIERYGCAKQARQAIRAGRPVPRPTPHDDDRDDTDDATTHRQDVRPGAAQRDTETTTRDRDTGSEPTGRDGPGRDEQRDTRTRDGHPGTAGRDVAEHPDADDQRPNGDGNPTPDEQPDQGHAGSAGADAGRDDEGDQHNPGEHALSVRMLAYARQRLADGATVTGADLDRHFGTRDYGRRILRRLANEPATGATTGEPAATRAA